MVFLNVNRKNLEQYTHRYYMDACVENGTLCIEIFDKDKITIKKNLKVKNIEQILDFCDIMNQCFTDIRNQVISKTIPINNEFEIKEKPKIVDLNIDSNKPLDLEIDEKLEDMIYLHE